MNDQFKNDSLSALHGAAEGLHPAHSDLAATLRCVIESPADYPPREILAVGLNEMAGENGLRNAAPIGWAYIVGDQIIETHHDDGANHRFAAISKGSFSESLRDLMEQTEAELGDFVLLRVLGLHITALWVNKDRFEKERLILPPPAPRYLQAWPKAYLVKEFEDALRGEAKRLLQFDNSPLIQK